MIMSLFVNKSKVLIINRTKLMVTIRVWLIIRIIQVVSVLNRLFLKV